MSDPSFAQLFQRSKYCRIGPLGADERGNERLEIFVVAAVGFALKHDTKFRKKFLRNFVGILDDSDGFEPSIQAAHYADLKFENRGNRTLVVVEFKIWAKLKPHQDPWSEPAGEPFWRDGEGYGWQLKSNYGQFSKIHYVVVQQNETRREKFSRSKSAVFYLKSRPWSTLLDLPLKALEKDLVMSLGEFRIGELEDYRMKEIKTKTEDLEAFFKGQSAMELLMRISKKLGMRKGSAESDLINYSTGGSHQEYRQLGIRLRPIGVKVLGGSRPEHLTDTWLGYLSENGQDFKAQVWFYCTEHSKPKLRSSIEKELSGLATIQEFYEDSDYGLRLIISDRSPLKDFDWFCKVLGIK